MQERRGKRGGKKKPGEGGKKEAGSEKTTEEENERNRNQEVKRTKSSVSSHGIRLQGPRIPQRVGQCLGDGLFLKK